MWRDAWEYLSSESSWWGRNGLANLLWNHVRLSATAVLAAIAVAVPSALLLGHKRIGGTFAIALVNLSRALPTFAVIALVFPISLQLGFGLGFWPTFPALFLLALPPIFVNTYTGVSGIGDEVVEAARAMGMRERQVLAQVELPSALPLLVTGIRISAVQVVATTTLGALVGFRCLGTPILQALATRDSGKLVIGALLVATLSLLTEAVFAMIGSRLTPWSRTAATPDGPGGRPAVSRVPAV